MTGEWRRMDALERMLAGLFLIALTLFFGMLLLAVASVPYAIRKAAVQKVCLERGFPRAVVTWDFAGYCATLDGGVTIRVERI